MSASAVKWTYDEALEHLHSLYKFGVRPGMDRITALLARLGDPQLHGSTRYLHIAGTNGKGSCAAMLESMLRAAGCKTGLFTSPHLHSHCERYRINNVNMPEEDFARLFPCVWQAIDEMIAAGGESPTEFEAVTALALLYFNEQQVDWAVMECGMGGRLDSTNVIPAKLALITSVGMDHMAVLGTDIPAIAAEKAGIIKPGATVVSAAQGEAAPVIAAHAVARSARLLTLGEDFAPCAEQTDMTGSVFSLRTPERVYKQLYLPLTGRHQLLNAAAAVTVAEQIGLSEAAIRDGLAAVRWPGRLELLSREPLIVIDGAHNEPGMCVLADALREYWPQKNICALLGMLADKQREQAISHLLPQLTQVVVTPPHESQSRAGDWQRLAAICRQNGVPARIAEDNAEALRLALATLDSGACDMLLVTGSLYLLADIRQLLLQYLAARS